VEQRRAASSRPKYLRGIRMSFAATQAALLSAQAVAVAPPSSAISGDIDDEPQYNQGPGEGIGHAHILIHDDIEYGCVGQEDNTQQRDDEVGAEGPGNHIREQPHAHQRKAWTDQKKQRDKTAHIASSLPDESTYYYGRF